MMYKTRERAIAVAAGGAGGVVAIYAALYLGAPALTTEPLLYTIAWAVGTAVAAMQVVDE